MPSAQAPRRTPLRRVSQGSLFALSRSGAYPDAPQGLGFLEPVMSELVDETEALQANVEGMKRLSDTLTTFNDSFASFLYIMNMNALTTDWTQAPSADSFMLAKRRAEEDALRAIESFQSPKLEPESSAATPYSIDKTINTEMMESDTTLSANVTGPTSMAIAKGGLKKKATKPKLSAKERKERNMELEKIISCLPLEFRGSDQNLRRHMETVIDGLMNAPDQTVKLPDLISPPDLNQARVNKCLIALVNRKAVVKDNSSGTVLYRWQGIP